MRKGWAAPVFEKKSGQYPGVEGINGQPNSRDNVNNNQYRQILLSLKT
jgi:hypothetical protein